MKDLRNRCTIRKYTHEPISEELLNELLEQASQTQTMGNLQLYTIIVTRSQEMKEKLAPLHFNQPMVTSAPVVITICADFRRTTDWCIAKNATPGYDNLFGFQNASTDALLYTQTLSVLAEEKGLGVCFLGTTIYTASAIIELLQLPKLVFPIATLTLGWPDENPNKANRLPLNAIVHQEVYTPPTEEELLAQYAFKESLPENVNFIEENKKENLAQVVTDCRYSKKDYESFSDVFLKTLVQQGFFPATGQSISSLSPILESRPEILECDVVRFQNKKEKWVAFVGLHEGLPYEIFTGLMDDDEGIMLPKRVSKGFIIKQVGRDGQKRYDFQFQNKRGYKTTVEGLSSKFNPEYWNYAKLISGVLRYKMPIEHVIKLVSSLQLDTDQMNSWTTGVVRALKRYIPGVQEEEEE